MHFNRYFASIGFQGCAVDFTDRSRSNRSGGNIIDDIFDTAGTLVNGVQAIMSKGAKAVYAAVLGSRGHAWPVGLGSALALLAALAGIAAAER